MDFLIGFNVNRQISEKFGKVNLKRNSNFSTVSLTSWTHPNKIRLIFRYHFHAAAIWDIFKLFFLEILHFICWQLSGKTCFSQRARINNNDNKSQCKNSSTTMEKPLHLSESCPGGPVLVAIHDHEKRTPNISPNAVKVNEKWSALFRSNPSPLEIQLMFFFTKWKVKYFRLQASYKSNYHYHYLCTANRNDWFSRRENRFI